MSILDLYFQRLAEYEEPGGEATERQMLLPGIYPSDLGPYVEPFKPSFSPGIVHTCHFCGTPLYANNYRIQQVEERKEFEPGILDPETPIPDRPYGSYGWPAAEMERMVTRTVMTCERCSDNFECEMCGETKKKDGSVDTLSIGLVCAECFAEEGGAICEECGECDLSDEMEAKYQGLGKNKTIEAFFCKKCAAELMCHSCEEIVDKEEIVWSELTGHKFCDNCYAEIFGMCEGCGFECYNEDLRISPDGDAFLCERCFDEANPNQQSYELIDAEYGHSRIEPDDDKKYFIKKYPHLYEMPKDLSRKGQKQWNYVKNWFGDFENIPPMNVNVTRPSTDYEGTYIEFNMEGRGWTQLQDLTGKSKMPDIRDRDKSLYHIFSDFNSQHPCLVSGAPERLIVCRVHVDDSGDWHIKLMQGSVNQGARKELVELSKAVEKNKDNLEKLKSFDPNVEQEAIYKDIIKKTSNAESQIKTLQQIVNYTNGAYIAAYDWIKKLADYSGASCYVQVPTEQARQHPDAPKMTLDMIYGALPYLMGFQRIKKEEGGQGNTIHKIAELFDRWFWEEI